MRVLPWRPISARTGSAGRSAATRFRQERLKNLKSDWRLWLAFVGLGVLAVAFIVWFGGVGKVVGGWMLGFISAICLFGWMIGFNVHSLPWLWGSWGEEDTEQELRRLGDGWSIRHDIPNPYGNWDHVAVGPAGVFMIESKRLRGRIKIDDGGLSSGRLRFGRTTFLGAAAGLKDALAAEAGRCPWVQAVVAVWGDAPFVPQQRDRVVYVSGAQLADWLKSRPVAIDSERRASLVEALMRL